jgi:hypothetical protein
MFFLKHCLFCVLSSVLLLIMNAHYTLLSTVLRRRYMTLLERGVSLVPSLSLSLSHYFWHIYIRYIWLLEVLVARVIKITACWHVKPCSLMEGTSVLEECAAQIMWHHVFKDVVLTCHILWKSRLLFVIAVLFSFHVLYDCLSIIS